MTTKTQEKPAEAKTAKTPVKRVEPEITTISTAIPVPLKTRRGAKSMYPFDDLQPGASFGVKNKTAASMSSIVSSNNRRNLEPKKDENGNVIYKMKKIKGADGTEMSVPTDKPETVEMKRFVCADVDPKTDPDGASVRVWRQV